MTNDERTALLEALDSLSWTLDDPITNHFGEEVWLGPCFNSEGKRIGITDCCFQDSPCEHHAEVARRRALLAAIPAAGGN